MFVIQTVPSVAAHTGYVPPTVIPPETTSNSITVSWPAPPRAADLLENYLLKYSSLEPSSRRRKRQTSRTVPVPASQTSYTLTAMRDNILPFTNYTLQVFANFTGGLLSSIVDPFTTRTGEAGMLTAQLCLSIL